MPVAPATLTPEREAALLARARAPAAAEREAAFEELFRELREPILALCLHLTGRRADAEDALQEVFLAVYRGIAAFRGDSRLYTWAYRIAIRVALRVKSRRPPRTGSLESDPADAPARRAKDPLVAREESDRLQAALARLPADHRIVLSLFAIEGLPHREIAAILGIPEGTVWSRLHLARKKLASLIASRG